MVQAPHVVAGLRASAGVAAAAAAATGRTVRLVDDLAGLLEVVEHEDASSLLIVPGARLDVGGAMAIARTSAARRRPVGFLATWLGRHAVERQLGKLRQPPRTGGDADLVFAQLGFAPLAGTAIGGARLTLLAGTDGALAERFSAPHRLLAVAAYGSAVDAEIGRSYVCALDDPASWPCHLGGLCLERHRAGAGPDRVARMGARDVAADCVIWGVCGAIALAGSVVDPGDSVVAGFLDSTRCGAVIAPCKVTELDHALLLFGAALARSGATLGEVALRLNLASLAGSSADAPWLLLGDPAARLEAVDPAPVAIPDQGLELTVQPGRPRLLRHRPDDAVVTWEHTGDDQALARRLLVQQLPGTGHALAFLTAGDPVSLTLRASRPDQLPAELAQALSIWTGAGPRAALRRLLGAAARLLDAPDAADLDGQLLGWSRSAWTHLGADRRRAASERRRWAAVHQRALEHLATLLARSPAALGYLHRTSGPSPGWRAREDPCPYCAAPLEESLYHVEGSPEARGRVQCARCGPISDAPVEAGIVHIDAESEGGGLRWSIALPGAGWRYRAATVAFEPVPWPVAEAATTAGGWSGPGDDRPLSGCVTLRRDVREGLYSCVAVALSQGEVYLARRFVRIGAAGVAPRG